MNTNQTNLSKQIVLAAATDLARKCGLLNFTRSDVAEMCGISAGSVSSAYGSMDYLRAAVIEHAIEADDWEIVGQAIALRHKSMQDLAPDYIKRALRSYADAR